MCNDLLWGFFWLSIVLFSAAIVYLIVTLGWFQEKYYFEVEGGLSLCGAVFALISLGVMNNCDASQGPITANWIALTLNGLDFVIVVIRFGIKEYL